LPSKLHPYVSNSTVLVRWTATPVFSASNTNSSQPDGVLLNGDIINGKIGYNEMIVSQFQDGYAGTYFYDNSSSQFVLLSAVRWDNGNLVIDESIPEALNSLHTALNTNQVSTVEGTFAGTPFELTSEEFELSIFFSCTGEEIPLLNSVYNPPLYQVRTVSSSHWISLRQKQLAIQIVSVVVQVISTVGISYLLFLPIYRFVQVIETELGKAPNRTGGGVKSFLGRFYTSSEAKKSAAKDSEGALSSVG